MSERAGGIGRVIGALLSTSGLALIGLAALLELIVEIATQTLFMSPSFGPLRFRGQLLETLACVWFLTTLAMERTIQTASPRELQERLKLHQFLLSTLGAAMVAWAAFAGRNQVLPAQYYIAGICAIGIFLRASLSATIGLGVSLRHTVGDVMYVSRRAETWGAVLCGVCLLAWAPRTAAKENIRSGAQFHTWFQNQPRKVFPVPVDNPGVLVVEFIDYQCPFCLEADRRYRDTFARLQAESAGRVKIVRYDFALNTACNPTPQMQDVHVAACDAAVAVRLARVKGKEEEMTRWLWDNQANLSKETISQHTHTVLGVDADDEMRSRLIAQIRAEGLIGYQLGVTQTPTFWVNGVMLQGASPQSFRWAVEQELQASPLPRQAFAKPGT